MDDSSSTVDVRVGKLIEKAKCIVFLWYHLSQKKMLYSSNFELERDEKVSLILQSYMTLFLS